MRNLALIASLVITTACSPPHVQRFPEKPPNCALEVVKSLPERPYIEIETIQLPSVESTRDVLDHVQERACRDGADAVYAPKGGRVYSYAIALKWNDAPAVPAASPTGASAPAEAPVAPASPSTPPTSQPPAPTPPLTPPPPAPPAEAPVLPPTPPPSGAGR